MPSMVTLNNTHLDALPTLPIYALICAAGVGARAGGEIPKQYQTILGQPMLWHTIAAFARCDAVARVCVVISPNDAWFAQAVAPLIAEAGWIERVRILPQGGDTRAESVRNGLAVLDEELSEDGEAWVMVHDAARPCVTGTAIERLRDAVWAQAAQMLAQKADWQSAGGILAQPVTDTIKLSQDGVQIKKTVDRSVLWAAQTPQMFTVTRLYNALCDALTDPEVAKTITDEASVMEWSGFDPLLVKSDACNLKVTYAQDFELAGFYLTQTKS